MKRLIKAAVVSLTLGPGLGPALADPTDEALSRWLAGEEAVALNTLSALSVSGDARAQLALGLIDAEPLYHGPWLMSLDRGARIAVLRQAGGLSGRNWMRDLADGPAPLWQAAWDGSAEAGLVLDFLAAGEDRAALVVALRLTNRQKRGFDGLALDGGSPTWLHLLSMRDSVAAGQAAIPLPDSLNAGDPAVHHFLGGPLPDATVLAAWLNADPMAAPIRSYCETQCTETAADTCHEGLFRAIGGYPALARVRSPSSDLIAEDQFATSAVARQMLDQLVADGDENARRTRSDGPICSG